MKLTNEMKARIKSLAYNAYCGVAFDLHSALRESGERLTLAIAVEQVAETLDFDKFIQKSDSDAYKAYNALSMDEQDKIVRSALRGRL